MGYSKLLGCIFILFMGGMVTSCTTLDLPNAYRLQKTDPHDISSEHGRVAIIWPKDIQSDSFTFEFTFKETEAAKPLKEVFTLDIDRNAKPLIKLPKGENLGALTVYQLPATEQARAQAFKDTLIKRGPKASGKGTLNTSFSFAIRPENKAAQRYCEDKKKREKTPFYAWVKINENEPYRRIVRTKSIDKIFKGSVNAVCWQLKNPPKDNP